MYTFYISYNIVTIFPLYTYESCLSLLTVTGRIDPDADCTTCGSFRRGKADCGDVDILITPSDSAVADSLPANTLSRLLLALERRGFLTDHLSLPSGHQEYVANSALQQQMHYQATAGTAGSSYAKSSSGHSHRSSSQRSGHIEHNSKAGAVTQHQAMSQSPLAGAAVCDVNSPTPSQLFSALSPVGQSGSHVSEALGSEALRVSESALSLSDEDCEGEASDWVDSNGEEQYTDGYGTQSGEEGQDNSVKYDTYGGKKKKSAHRLYFGSRGSYMGVCIIPGEGAIHRRIDIKVWIYSTVVLFITVTASIYISDIIMCILYCRCIRALSGRSLCSTSPARTASTAGCASTPPSMVLLWTTRCVCTTRLYFIVVYYTITLCYTVRYYTVMYYCVALYCTKLHFFVLYCTVYVQYVYNSITILTGWVLSIILHV